MTNAVILCVLTFSFLLQSTKCARKAMEGFVIGGSNSKIVDYPHSVFINANCDSEWICGGAILNQRMVITAAHCLFGCELRHGHKIVITAGTAYLKSVW